MGHIHIPLSRGGYALLNESAANVAIVFVHGYLGNCYQTWLDFQTLIDTSRFPIYAQCDLFFFSYNSSRVQIDIAADECWRFVRDIFPRPKSSIYASDLSALPFVLQSSISQELNQLVRDRYDHLILVGHSMGAVILRGVVLKELVHAEQTQSIQSRGKNPLLLSEMRLFAPAHSGRQLSGIMGLAANLPLLGSTILQWWESFSSGAVALRPDDRYLAKLKKRTEEKAYSYPRLRALRAHCVFGSNEEVVIADRYETDFENPATNVISGKGHQEICKPKNDYLFPLEFVISGLSLARKGRTGGKT